MAKKENKNTDCISCKGKETVPLIINIPDDLSKGFDVEFKKCKKCGHLMTNEEIESFFSELPSEDEK